jgi:hypothetical protein
MGYDADPVTGYTHRDMGAAVLSAIVALMPGVIGSYRTRLHTTVYKTVYTGDAETPLLDTSAGGLYVVTGFYWEGRSGVDANDKQGVTMKFYCNGNYSTAAHSRRLSRWNAPLTAYESEPSTELCHMPIFSRNEIRVTITPISKGARGWLQYLRLST